LTEGELPHLLDRLEVPLTADERDTLLRRVAGLPETD
jgi:hypothetical protein